MDVFLLEVEFVFSIAPKKRVRPVLFPPLRDDGPQVHKGASIVLLLPDSREIETTIWDLKHFNIKPYRGLWTIELSNDLKVEDVPVGTQVWMRELAEGND